MVLKIESKSGNFNEFNIDSSEGWSKKVIQIVEEIAKGEEEQ